MLQKYKNIGGIATKRLIWYMETILSSSYSLFYASLSSFCSCCFSWLCNDIVHCWRHNAARLAFAFLIWSSMCMCIQCKSFHVSNFSAFRIFAKHSNQRVLYIYIFYGNVCLYIILIVPSDRCWWWCCCRFLLLLFPSRCFMWFCNGALRANKMAYSLIWLMWSAHVYPIHGWNNGLASYMNYSCGNGVHLFGHTYVNIWFHICESMDAKSILSIEIGMFRLRWNISINVDYLGCLSNKTAWATNKKSDNDVLLCLRVFFCWWRNKICFPNIY